MKTIEQVSLMAHNYITLPAGARDATLDYRGVQWQAKPARWAFRLAANGCNYQKHTYLPFGEKADESVEDQSESSSTSKLDKPRASPTSSPLACRFGGEGGTRRSLPCHSP